MSDRVLEMVRECTSLLEGEQLDDVVQRRHRLTQSTSSMLRLTPAFSITALVVSLVMTSFIVIALVRRRIPSRKYIVVLSRVLSDVFSSAVVSAASLFASSSSASHTILALFLFVSSFSFLQLSLSHLFVIVLRHISVTRPYGFQSICTVRRVCTVVAIGWIISILYAAAYTPLATVIIDSDRQDVCSFSGCQRPLLSVCLGLFCLLVVSLPAIYGAVAIKLKTIAHSERMHNEPELTRKKLRAFLYFGGHIALFLLATAFLIAGAGLILANAKTYDVIRNKMREECDVAEMLSVVVRLEVVSAGALLFWSVRIIFDDIILLLIDWKRLLPWVNHENLEPLRDNQVSSRSHTLQWQKGCLNCPVFNIDSQFHPWDFKN